MTKINDLATKILGKEELELVDHLFLLFNDESINSSRLIGEIIPRYWEDCDTGRQSIEPDCIYRALYYIHFDSEYGSLKYSSRSFLQMMSNHLEGCLQYLLNQNNTSRSNLQGSFGQLAFELSKGGIITKQLKDELQKFNNLIDIPSKHMKAYLPTRQLSERTFSVLEAAEAFVLMRKLSIQLFSIMRSTGIGVTAEWPSFNPIWLTWLP
jgi:hypothetical protein